MQENLLPYITFSGKFYTDPSSVNSYMENYKRAKQLSYSEFKEWLKSPEADEGSNWIPYGGASWKFIDCKIQSVTYMDGSSTDKDSLVNAEINPAAEKINGRIVDLDPEQTSSEIWGFEIRISDLNHNYINGKFMPAPFLDSWKRDHSVKIDPQATDKHYQLKNKKETYDPYSVTYKSILESVSFNNHKLSSKILKEFDDISKKIGSSILSIKFTVDGYDYASATGRVVGVITPHLYSQSISLAASRQLVSSSELAGNAYFQVKKIKDSTTYQLVLDLSNTIPTRKENEKIIMDHILGDLKVGLYVNDEQHVIGTIELSKYKDEKWYTKYSGIESINISEKYYILLKNNPLYIWNNSSGPILKEDLNGLFVKPEVTIYRLNPDEKQTIKFAVTRFGQPVENEYIDINEEDITVVSTVKDSSGKIIKWKPISRPKVESSHIKISNGYATTNIIAPSSIGNPRSDYFLDSVVFKLDLSNKGAFNFKSNYPIYFLIFDRHDKVLIPTWKQHIEPILKHYACLYPLMGELFGLASYEKITQNIKAMERSLSAPMESAHYMPVKRDLSYARREMLLHWLKQPYYTTPLSSNFHPISCIEDLKKALQSALELEHATIPVYMTALYSIKTGTNVEVAKTIQGILVQEMSHVALVCNLINAIGGKPKFTNHDFMPKFPGNLPYDIHPDLIVSLGACTKDRIKSVFMHIEQPGENLTFNVEETVDGIKVTWTQNKMVENTIGQFYALIQDAFERFSKTIPNLFCGQKDLQVSTTHMPGLIKVDNLQTALEAIAIIVKQGEGVSLTNITQSYDGQISHYHKFLEIFTGKRLLNIKETSEGVYTPVFSETDNIVLNEHEIIDPWKDIKQENLTDEEKKLIDDFNLEYVKLLINLQKTFNGEAHYLESAIALMRQIQINCMSLLNPAWRGLNKNGRPIAPNFDIGKYLPKKDQVETLEQVLATVPAELSMPLESMSSEEMLRKRLSVKSIVSEGSGDFLAAATESSVRERRNSNQLLSEYKNVSFFKPSSDKKEVSVTTMENEPKFQGSYSKESIGQTVSLNILGLQYQKIPGNGHCLYNAVGMYLNRSQELLREDVAKYLENHLEEFRGFLQTQTGQPPENYIQGVKQGKEWAANAEIEVLMRMFNRPIIVIDSNGKIINTEVIERFKGEHIFVYYNGHNHYDALLKDENITSQEIIDYLKSFHVTLQRSKT